MDPATRELPRVALAAVRPNGTIDLATLIRSMMREPSEFLILMRTALDALIGFAALLRCRQLLGSGLALPSLHEREAGPKPSVEIYANTGSITGRAIDSKTCRVDLATVGVDGSNPSRSPFMLSMPRPDSESGRSEAA